MSIYENLGSTASKESWLDDNGDFTTLFPIVKNVAAKTLAQELIFATDDEIKEVEDKVKAENREGKIDAVLENKKYVEKKLEDDPEYKELMNKGVTPLSAPRGNLFYLDYKYDIDLFKDDES